MFIVRSIFFRIPNELSILSKTLILILFLRYLLSMQSAKDVEEYLTELLGTRGVAFRREFLSRWHPSRGAESPVSQPEGQDLMEQLTRPSQEDMVLFRGEGGRGKGVGTGWFTAGSSKVRQTDTSDCVVWSLYGWHRETDLSNVVCVKLHVAVQ